MTKVEIKEHSGCTKKLHVEVERERFDSELEGTLKKLQKDIQIPGFRKGKAPESLISRRFGSAIREEAVKELIPKILLEVLESEGINPVGEPAISDFKFDQTGPITFTVSVEEVPEVDLSGIQDIQVTRTIVEITDEDVENALERYRQMRSEQKEVDREARKGDMVIANFQKLDLSGVPIIGEKNENQLIVLEPNSVPSPEFIKQIAGMKAGDRRTVRFTYDETFSGSEIARESEAYEVEAVQILENIVPELNDEFAASTGLYTDLEDLHEKTRKHLEKQEELNAEQKLRADLIDEFIRQNPFEVPDSMVKRIMFAELENLKNNSPDQPLDEESFLKEIRPDAVRAVQTYLIIDEVKARNNIDVTREEVDERIEILAERNGMNPKELRRQLIKNGQLEDIKNDIAQKKVYDWIIENAKVTDEKVKTKKDGSNIIIPDRSML